ncbi:hypothetical protein FJ964_00005, partial [Mesorhizobium sp. B2-3-2]
MDYVAMSQVPCAWRTPAVNGVLPASRKPIFRLIWRLMSRPKPESLSAKSRWRNCQMKTRAAVAVAAGKPLEIMEVDLDGPR